MYLILLIGIALTIIGLTVVSFGIYIFLHYKKIFKDLRDEGFYD